MTTIVLKRWTRKDLCVRRHPLDFLSAQSNMRITGSLRRERGYALLEGRFPRPGRIFAASQISVRHLDGLEEQVIDADFFPPTESGASLDIRNSIFDPQSTNAIRLIYAI